ncbi:MAG: class I SAM-dependent RNA methyltransferase [Deltaproteobacteria bacterium]|nr:class I SAM-dependent RNA methyltransferase [Deltaproteobacteria bacterium]
MLQFFAASAPGLEPLLIQELHRLGLKPTSSSSSFISQDEQYETGGVEFEGSLKDLYLANLHLRTASRILVRLGSFEATRFPELRRKAANLPWEQYLSPGMDISLRVACHASRLYHQRAVAERVVGAISDRLGQPPCVRKLDEEATDSSPKLILVRIQNNQCTISVDSSGPLLHRRGYRLATAKAPLRETLAAAMLLAGRWDGIAPLIDPFCGSGTIPIEAALLAREIPPGYQRTFTFMNWPSFDKSLWDTIRAFNSDLEKRAKPEIIGSDRDAGAIQAARANAERAGLSDTIEFTCQAVSYLDPPVGPGWIVTNPPYGKRLPSNKDLRNLYAQFGKTLRSKCPGWKVVMLCDSIQLVKATGLKFEEVIPTLNGGLKVKIFVGHVD